MLTADQLAGWHDYATREPFGFPIADIQAATIMSVIAHSVGSKVPAEDFMLQQKFADGPDNEDGTPSDAALSRKLEQAFAMKRPPTEE